MNHINVESLFHLERQKGKMKHQRLCLTTCQSVSQMGQSSSLAPQDYQTLHSLAPQVLMQPPAELLHLYCSVFKFNYPKMQKIQIALLQNQLGIVHSNGLNVLHLFHASY